jgi:hypothetical protein
VNAGRDYRKARRQAQANADLTGTPRWLHLYGGVWWISKDAGNGEGREAVFHKETRGVDRKPNAGA